MNYTEKYNNEVVNDKLGNSLSLLNGLTFTQNKNLSYKLEFGVLNEYNTLFRTDENTFLFSAIRHI